MRKPSRPARDSEWIECEDLTGRVVYIEPTARAVYIEPIGRAESIEPIGLIESTERIERIEWVAIADWTEQQAGKAGFAQRTERAEHADSSGFESPLARTDRLQKIGRAD